MIHLPATQLSFQWTLATWMPSRLQWVAWCQLASGVIAFAINTHYSRKLLGYGPVAMLPSILPPTLPPILLLSLQVAAGAIIYLGLVFVLRLKAMQAAWEAWKGR